MGCEQQRSGAPNVSFSENICSEDDFIWDLEFSERFL